MATIQHGPSSAFPEKRRPGSRFLVREMWASLAIASMWVAVLFSAVFGPDFVSTSAGTNTTRIPSAVFVALFAAIATRAVAKYGFGERPDDEAGERPG